MFPLSDDNPHFGTPFVTWTIIGLCVAVYLWQFTLGETALREAVYALGVVPSSLLGGARLPEDIALVSPWMTVFTSMFLHGGFMHLGGNMLYLWIFGDNIEVAMGWKRFIVFYLLCGIAAALAQALVNPTSNIPMIGASGAIAGVLGAYLLLYPRARVRVFMFPFGIFGVPAVIVLGFWFLLQLVNSAGMSDGGGVAYLAHVGGFVAGLVLAPLFRRKSVPLFAKARHRPFYKEPRQIYSGKRPRGQGPWGRRPGPSDNRTLEHALPHWIVSLQTGRHTCQCPWRKSRRY